jgi:hypothetical protein
VRRPSSPSNKRLPGARGLAPHRRLRGVCGAPAPRRRRRAAATPADSLAVAARPGLPDATEPDGSRSAGGRLGVALMARAGSCSTPSGLTMMAGSAAPPESATQPEVCRPSLPARRVLARGGRVAYTRYTVTSALRGTQAGTADSLLLDSRAASEGLRPGARGHGAALSRPAQLPVPASWPAADSDPDHKFNLKFQFGHGRWRLVTVRAPGPAPAAGGPPAVGPDAGLSAVT